MADILVQNLFSWVDERSIHRLFSMFGKISSVDVVGPTLASSFPYWNQMVTSTCKQAVVHFVFKKDACLAVDKMNMAMTDIGQPLLVQNLEDSSSNSIAGISSCHHHSNFRNEKTSAIKPRSHQTLLLVKNFKDELDEDDLRSLFSVFGTVKSCSIKREEGKSLGYGYVDFAKHDSAIEAIQHMNGTEIKGQRHIEVTFVEKKENREQCIVSWNGNEWSDQSEYVIYIMNLPYYINNEELIKLFCQFGGIKSVSVKRKEGRKGAVGFISFSRSEEADMAISKMNGYVLNNSSLAVVKKKSKNAYKGSYPKDMSLVTCVNKHQEEK